MIPESKSTVFRRLAGQLRAGCERHGLDLPGGVAEHILAERINAVAARLRISDQHVMRTYCGEDAIAALVEVCLQVRVEQDREIEQASPMLLPVPHAATVIGALAASCQAATTAANRAETTTAVIESTAAILAIAGAIARSDLTGPAILDAQTAVIARTQLSTMVDRLGDGTWHMPGHENLIDLRQHDLAMRDRIEHDLQLLS
jgi:hypothetical protein